MNPQVLLLIGLLLFIIGFYLEKWQDPTDVNIYYNEKLSFAEWLLLAGCVFLIFAWVIWVA